MAGRTKLTQGSDADFERRGYTIYRDVVDADLIAEASRHVDWLVARNPDTRSENLGTRLVGDDPFWLRLVSDPRLLDIAEQYIGPDIALFASHYISKPAGDGQPVLWHQDGSYWPLEPMEVISLWLAIDDSTPENGCLRVIPGSQHLGLQDLERRDDVANVLGSGINTSAVDEDAAVDVVLRAGDVSIHHPNVIHGSNANTSAYRRCGLTIRYIPTTTRIVSEDPWASAFLLRGKGVEDVNDYRPLPTWDAGRHMAFRGCENWAPM
ncbi:phytanoyl-CoA dioxygenase family protein [Sphingopyxis sp.]|uniref:phytanoyl-CoA dioxygenase family protein n=1 Tax=Sphingopyxis sp. TaxID=1908224 RepID=UPI003D6D6DD5